MDFSLERRYLSRGFQLVGGVDEVGRGAVAGPLFVGLTIFFKLEDDLIFWTDSKQIYSQRRREEIFMKLLSLDCLVWSVGWVDAFEIDRNGIVWALGEALRRAIAKLPDQSVPSILLTDGKFPFPGIEIPQRPIVKGDALSPSIAAASIIAKVIRDIYVASIEGLKPYGVLAHKGYATKLHQSKIKELGLSSWHRKTFLKKFLKEGE